jgi:hypothetical protein
VLFKRNETDNKDALPSGLTQNGVSCKLAGLNVKTLASEFPAVESTSRRLLDKEAAGPLVSMCSMCKHGTGKVSV